MKNRKKATTAIAIAEGATAAELRSNRYADRITGIIAPPKLIERIVSKVLDSIVGTG
jgi:hypothetical protein